MRTIITLRRYVKIPWDKFDQTATRAMPAGTFGFWPAEMKHFAWAKGETVLQLHGTGPWTITYVNAADDPRNMKK